MEEGAPKWKGAAWPGARGPRRIWWVAKNSGVASLIWRDLKLTLQGVWTEKNEVERRVVLPGGGEIAVKSGDEPDSLRGPGLDGLVIDEAAHQVEEVWTVMRPALADRQGWAIFISTPSYKWAGKWFERLYDDAGRIEGWARWQRPTSDNPLVPASEIRAAKVSMAPLLFRQEFLAEFISRAGAVFQVDWFRYYGQEGNASPGAPGERTGVYMLHDPELGDRRVMEADGTRFGTVDLAASLRTSADYTAIASMQATGDKDLILLEMDRRRLEGPDQLPAVRAAIDRWRLGQVWIEKQGYQLAMVQAATRAGLPVRELVADRDKLSRAMPLQARMAAGKVWFREGAPWLYDLECELLAFTGEPDGKRGDGLEEEVDYHDDMADALAYGAQIIGQVSPPQVFGFGIDREEARPRRRSWQD
jgi:predicted phage terminase large subunit-like protein